MNIFTVVRNVLDDLFTKIEPAGDRVKILSAEMQHLKKQYWNLASRTQPVDYSRPETRFAYIFNYVTAHANFVYDALQVLDQKTRVFQELAEIEITSLGGGPGTDLLGAIKYMALNAPDHRLAINIVDREMAWGGQWRHIRRRIDFNEISAPDVQYDPIDVSDRSTWHLMDQIMDADVFVSSFFYSELVWLGEITNEFFAAVIERMKPQSYFILIDNKHKHFEGIVDILDKSDFELIHNGDGGLSVKRIDGDEIDEALRVYIDMFDFNPKMSQYNAIFRIYRKS